MLGLQRTGARPEQVARRAVGATKAADPHGATIVTALVEAVYFAGAPTQFGHGADAEGAKEPLELVLEMHSRRDIVMSGPCNVERLVVAAVREGDGDLQAEPTFWVVVEVDQRDDGQVRVVQPLVVETTGTH